jgi:transcriptional regulator with XRE-family HTH domain
MNARTEAITLGHLWDPAGPAGARPAPEGEGQRSSAGAWLLSSGLGPLGVLPTAPRLGRAFAVLVLGGWGLGGMAEAAELIVSELPPTWSGPPPPWTAVPSMTRMAGSRSCGCACCRTCGRPRSRYGTTSPPTGRPGSPPRSPGGGIRPGPGTRGGHEPALGLGTRARPPGQVRVGAADGLVSVPGHRVPERPCAKCSARSFLISGACDDVCTIGRQRLIGSSLRRYRESLGYDLGVAAQILECDPSKISRIETGQRGIRPKELRELLTEYGVDAATQDTLAAIARPGEDARWWREYIPVLSAGRLDYLAAESAASTIMAYAPVQIPELLHTPDYARAVASADVTVPEGGLS